MSERLTSLTYPILEMGKLEAHKEKVKTHFVATYPWHLTHSGYVC